MLAFRSVFFIGFLPVAVNSDKKIIRCFAEGMDHYTDGYMKKVLYMWALFVMEFGAIVAIALFTLGVGLVIAISSVITINMACGFANYYQTRKENFYLSENTIVKPL